MAKLKSRDERERDSRRGNAPREHTLSIVAPGMHVVGDLITKGVVKVEGKVEGNVRADEQILVSKGGTVQGNLYTREAIVGGTVVGAIYAGERVEVQRGSLVNGDITTQRIVVQEGGEVNGRVQMGRPVPQTRPSQPQVPNPVRERREPATSVSAGR